MKRKLLMFVFVLFFIAGCSRYKNTENSSVETTQTDGGKSVVSESTSTISREKNQSTMQKAIRSEESSTTL